MSANPPSEGSRKDRRFPRVRTPDGVWVGWGTESPQTVSRVSDLNEAGLFISTPQPPAVGTLIKILLVVLEGEIKGHATVRSRFAQEGMGVEITAMGAEDTARFRAFVNRLLTRESSDPRNT